MGKTLARPEGVHVGRHAPGGRADHTPAPHSTAVSATGGPARLLRADQRRNWLRGHRVRVEDYLTWVPDLAADAEAVLDLVYGEFLLREELGERPDAGEYVRRFPRLADALRRLFRLHAAIRGDGLE